MYPRQFGFRARSGTETAALELAEQIKNMLDKKMKVSAVFMDIRKAFDFVNIECLLHTLNLSGIRGRTLKLVESYLRGRKQVVKINKATSNEKKIKHGVVQGSILGSLLFIIFFNQFGFLNTEGMIYTEDDAVLINGHDKNENIKNKIESDMGIILNFLE